MLLASYKHKGSSFLEIYQNCNIFNDGTFEIFTEKASKKQETLFMVHGQPLRFGENNEKGIRLDGMTPQVVTLGDAYGADDLMVHDETDLNKAWIVARMFDDVHKENHLPRPFGIFYRGERACYEEVMQKQIDDVLAKKGAGNLDKLLAGNEVWEIV
jgi:2-oxoglutarate ferredoxin oxidoreductase subunit beta